MRIDFPLMLRSLAELHGEKPLTDSSFGTILARMIATLVAFDHLVIFGYWGDRNPIVLFDTFDLKEHEIFVVKYQKGPYLLDPFYVAARQMKHGFWRMRDLAPDRFFSSEYFRCYYVETGLAEEVGFFVPVSGDTTVVLSLMRRDKSGVFSARDVEKLEALAPLISTLIANRWKDLSEHFAKKATSKNMRRLTSVEAPRAAWRELNLSSREIAVVELVLQGHSSESIALRLGISMGTVKVHRRNVYRKLNITSQTQLLAIYLNRIVQRR